MTSEATTKVERSGENLKIVKKRKKIYTYGILHVFNIILYENEFQNPQIFQQNISIFPEQSTLATWSARGPPSSINRIILQQCSSTFCCFCNKTETTLRVFKRESNGNFFKSLTSRFVLDLLRDSHKMLIHI
jgi:hypothetical protein